MKSLGHKKIIKLCLIIGLVLAGFSLAFVGIILTKPQNRTVVVEQANTSKPEQTKNTLSETKLPGLPLRISIPKINVSAEIDSLGLTIEGDLDAPKDITRAGWYNGGPRAGSPGNAVMDGHFGGTKSKPAAFDQLHTLQIGDRVTIEDSDKKTHVFVVTGTRTFQPEEDATEVFRSADNKPRLNLITCQGEWVSSKESYSTRLVVFTDLLVE